MMDQPQQHMVIVIQVQKGDSMQGASGKVEAPRGQLREPACGLGFA